MKKIKELIEVKKWWRLPKFKRSDKEVKTIRLAVVGMASSGKTYFLEDVVRSIEKLGYLLDPNVQIDGFAKMNMWQEHVNTDGFHKKTPRYVGCQEYHYAGQFRNRDGNKTIILEFMDVPGEIMKYTNIYTGVFSDLTKYQFRVRRWKSESKMFVYTVEYGDMKLDVDPSNDKISPNKGRRQDYNEAKVIVKDLKDKKFERDGSQRKISGSDLLDNLWCYNVDSVYCALNALAAEQGLQKLDDEDVLKTFYFFHFLWKSTDIVLCKKCIERIPLSPIDQNIEYGIVQVMPSLTNTMDWNGDEVKHHVYYAIKGVDTYLKQEFSEKAQRVLADNNGEESPHHVIYSQVADEIFQKIRDNDGNGNGQGGVWVESIPKNPSLRNWVQAVKSPHLYFVATPITIDYVIEQFSSTNGSDNEVYPILDDATRTKHPINRSCFGTIQLVTDILFQHDITNINDEYRHKKILNLYRGNDNQESSTE